MALGGCDILGLMESEGLLFDGEKEVGGCVDGYLSLRMKLKMALELNLEDLSLLMIVGH